jgi:predicted TIM-barrel fold metal-dependent hydrolase
MNVEITDRRPAAASTTKYLISDCDIHPARRAESDLFPYMDERWREHVKLFGTRQRQGFSAGPSYPKSQRNAARLDAWPPEGGKPGSDLKFLQAQLLDAHNIGFGLLNPVGDVGQSSHNQEFGAALSHAINCWQYEDWLSKEPRLKGSIVVPYENAAACVEEIDRWKDNKAFVQVLFQSRSAEPLGQRRYWPIYEAAVAADLPVGIHAFGFGGNPVTPSGHASYYIEDMVGHAQSCISLLTSMVLEGVFERFPKLRLVLIESGFGWLPSLGWRLDKIHRTMAKSETQHLKRLPSEYIRDQVWVTSQPMEEPQRRAEVLDIIEWIGWDKLMFATDYPHWDFDDPAHVLPVKCSDEHRRMFLRENALKLYRQN